MKGTLSELHRRGNDVQRKGLTNNFIHFLIDSLWRDPVTGGSGRDVELSTSAGYVVWRYVGETVWNNLFLIPADGTDGDDGADGVKPIQVTDLTLVAANWVADGDLKKYVLANANITATTYVEVIPANASVAIVKAAEVLPETDSAAGTVSIWAVNTPSGDISVTINIYQTA